MRKTKLSQKSFWLLSLFALQLFLGAPAYAANSGAVVKVEEQCDLQILTPSLSERKSAKIILASGLKVYLVSDPSSPTSGAALAVEAGSFNDPADYPGMAHFVEHMLFMGTQKYPEEHDFHAFLATNGGKLNAFTTEKRTVFIFSIENNAYEAALDRFSQFFIAPLFRPESIESEWHAVDEEFSKYITSDSWRILQVKKALANPLHPFHLFSIGNRLTLSKMPSETMRSWYQSHYSANQMNLVLYSPKSLEEMQRDVLTFFSEVPNRSVSLENYGTSLFPESLGGKLIAVTPEQAVQRLELSWELDRSVKECDAEEFASHMLGFEGEGSLLSLLKKEKLATGLGASVDRLGREERVFELSIDLTDSGLKNYPKVLELVFQAISTLKNAKIDPAFAKEYEEIKRAGYAYQEKGDLFDLLSGLAYHMGDEPLATFPQKMVLGGSFDPKAFSELLAGFTPERCNYLLVAPKEKCEFKNDRVEQWMQVPYSVQPIDSKTLALWSASLSHPAIFPPKPNRFLAKNLTSLCTLKAERSLIPEVKSLQKDSFGEILFAMDDRYGVPEINWNFTLKSPQIRPSDITSAVLSDLYVEIANHHLSEIAYEAKVAELTYSLAPTTNGLHLQVAGFSEKAELFLSEALAKIKQLKPTQEEFDLYKESLARSYENSATESPLAQAKELFRSVLYKDYASPELKAKCIKKVSFGDLERFASTLFHEGYVEATLFGNMTEQQGRIVAQKVTSDLFKKAYAKEKQPKVELALFPDKPYYLKKKSNLVGNSLILAINATPYNLQRQVVSELLSQGLSEPFFSEMRTRQHTAYLVRNSALETEKHLYLLFMIQSGSHDPRDLLSRFELFFEDFLANFSEAFPQEKFEAIRRAEIQAIADTAKTARSMGDLVHRLAFKDEDLGLLDKKQMLLQALSYEEFAKEAFELLGRENQKRVACAAIGKSADPASLSYQIALSLNRVRKEIDYSSKEPVQEKSEVASKRN